METFSIVQVPVNDAWNIENLGTKPKFWYRNEKNERLLYKEARPNTGEDWSEIIAEQLAALLDMPHATYKLAAWRDTRGVVTQSLVPSGASLLPGNVLLKAYVQNYPDNNIVSNFRNTQHTLNNIREILLNRNVGLPPDWNAPLEITNACELITGYFLLDALIGNTDRHHENWAVIGQTTVENRVRFYLAPTYDHASSLGCHLTDHERQERLTTRNMQRNILAYTNKARSAIYALETETKPMTPLEVFRSARDYAPDVGNYWLNRLETLSVDTMRSRFSYLPSERISPDAVEFAIRLLELNRMQLLELREKIK